MSKDKTIVYYHANCNDGFGAAWSAFQQFGWDAKYRQCSYGKPIPGMEKRKGCRIYFLDMSTSPEILNQLKSQGNEIVILDHHETAEESLKEYEVLPEEHNYNWDNGREVEAGISVRFDMKKSGAMLAWEYFQPNTEAPKMIKYIQDRDIWSRELPGTEEVNANLSSWRHRFDQYETFHLNMEDFFEDVLSQGRGILRAQKKTTEQICSNNKVIEWNGHRVAVVNCTTLWSDVGNHLIEMYDKDATDKYVKLDENDEPIRIDYAIAWSIHSRGSRFLMSLRSKGDFSVSKIAKGFGGGGHKNASGINMSLKDGLNILEEWGLVDENH